MESTSQAYELKHRRLQERTRLTQRRITTEVECLKQKIRVLEAELAETQEQRAVASRADADYTLDLLRYRHAWVMAEHRVEQLQRALDVSGGSEENQPGHRQLDYNCSSPIAPCIRRPGKRIRVSSFSSDLEEGSDASEHTG